MNRLTQRLFAFALIAGAAPLAAQQAGPGGIRGDFLASFNEAADKLVQLAEAIPAEKYSWRPGEGVRSVGEVLMHVSGASYLVLRAAGVQSPAGMTEDMGANTQKAEIVAFIKQSMDFARNALRNANEADLDHATKLFGMDMTYRGVYMLLVSHAHEHLGQMIAYARTNGVVPPWSRTAGM